MMQKRSIFILVVLLIFGSVYNAQIQIKAGEIKLYPPGNLYTYKADVVFIIDWPAVITRTYVNVDWGDGSPIEALPMVGGGPNTSQGYNFAILKFSGSHSYQQGSYTISVIDSFLVSGIVNIPNSEQQKIRLRNFFTTDLPPFYNEPVTLVGGGSGLVMPPVCDFQKVYIPFKEWDPNSDSLSYSIVDHLEYPGYVMPPALFVGGGLTFTSNVAPGRYNISLRMDEWRIVGGGNPPLLYGSTWREFFVEIADCTDLPESETEIFKVIPNPVNDQLTIQLISAVKGKGSYYVTDVGGKTILSGNIEKGTNEVKLNLKESCVAGLYFLTINDGDLKHSCKVVVE